MFIVIMDMLSILPMCCVCPRNKRNDKRNKKAGKGEKGGSLQKYVRHVCVCERESDLEKRRGCEARRRGRTAEEVMAHLRRRRRGRETNCEHCQTRGVLKG